MAHGIKYYLEILLDQGKFKSDKFLPFLQDLQNTSGVPDVLVRDPVTGEVKKQPAALFKYYQDATPDPDGANIKDIWFRPSDMKLFEVVEESENNYWAEISSPKIS